MALNLKSLFSLDANIVINRALARSWGLDAAAMFAYLVQVEPDPGAWFGITQKELAEATTLSVKQVRLSTETLKADEAIETRVAGLPARLQYRILTEKILKNPQFALLAQLVCPFGATGKNAEKTGTCGPQHGVDSNLNSSPVRENSDNSLINQILADDLKQRKKKVTKKKENKLCINPLLMPLESKSLLIYNINNINHNTTHTDITNITQTQHTATLIPQAPKVRRKVTYTVHFDEATAKIIGIPPETLTRWRGKYKIDVDREIGKAEEWLYANPLKRKQNYLRFLTLWFNNAEKNQPAKQQYEPEFVNAAERMRKILGIEN